MSATEIVNRLLGFCPTLLQYDIADRIAQCSDCGRFAVACCQHNSVKSSEEHCHHRRLVFTDGACSGNGQSQGATSGIGVVRGSEDTDSWSIPITEEVDGKAPRTSQRAELLAAITGVQVSIWEQSDRDMDGERDGTPEVVVATDSTYVVKGITEWMEMWEKNGWRTKQGKQPANLDLFRILESTIKNLEAEGVTFGFWLIPRELNEADALAKQAARSR
ncbi:ribonuclease H-like protein [Hymenopellis radicata]|nr:ribonuclease H-like protein [Hymenopellis radicata]